MSTQDVGLPSIEDKPKYGSADMPRLLVAVQLALLEYGDGGSIPDTITVHNVGSKLVFGWSHYDLEATLTLRETSYSLTFNTQDEHSAYRRKHFATLVLPIMTILYRHEPTTWIQSGWSNLLQICRIARVW